MWKQPYVDTTSASGDAHVKAIKIPVLRAASGDIMEADFLGGRLIGMRSHFLLVAALAAASAAQPASAGEAGAVLTNQEL